jgi:PPP family 3-phenylpropionic acid transporter
VPASLFTRPGLHTAAFYAALFMSTGAHLPFWPLWLANWGLSAADVGLFTGIAVRVVAGMAVPALADRFDRRRLTLTVCAVASTLLFLAHLGIRREGMLLAATLAVGIAMAGLFPIGEALGVAAARAWRFSYAQARGVGSIGFLLANLLVGALIARYGVNLALWWIVACLATVAALAWRHPGAGRVHGPAQHAADRAGGDPSGVRRFRGRRRLRSGEPRGAVRVRLDPLAVARSERRRDRRALG